MTYMNIKTIRLNSGKFIGPSRMTNVALNSFARIIVLPAVLLAACATPKYRYHFDHYTARPAPAFQATTPAVSLTASEVSAIANEQTATTPEHGTASDPTATASIDRSTITTLNHAGYMTSGAISIASINTLPAHTSQHQNTAIHTVVHPEGERLSDQSIKSTGKELIRLLKQVRKETKYIRKGAVLPADQATQKLDNEVIVAIAFGAVGITLSLLGAISAAFWIIGVICLGIGVYFFVDWLSRR